MAMIVQCTLLYVVCCMGMAQKYGGGAGERGARGIGIRGLGLGLTNIAHCAFAFVFVLQ